MSTVYLVRQWWMMVGSFFLFQKWLANTDKHLYYVVSTKSTAWMMECQNYKKIHLVCQSLLLHDIVLIHMVTQSYSYLDMLTHLFVVHVFMCKCVGVDGRFTAP